MDPVGMFRSMRLIRTFEEALMVRPDHGFQLLSAGQEAVAVGLCAALNEDDRLLCSGRSIAPALARGLAPGAVMAELLGKTAGPCRGRAGRGHISQPSRGFIGAHAVVAGNLTVAAGVALAHQLQGGSGIVACMFGDGACGSGALHETLNIATLWKLPLLLVCDNNQYSISTPASEALAPASPSDFAKPFRIPHATVDGMDVDAVWRAADAFVQHARAGGGPSFLECVSYRFASHSTSTRETRSESELAAGRARCPIERLAARLEQDGSLNRRARETLEDELSLLVAEALRFAESSPYPDAGEALADVG